MAVIAQRYLFCWDFVERMKDLERIRMVLDNLPDEPLMVRLESKRGRGRDDFSVRPMWNLVISFLLTGHLSWAALLRELNRNRDLVQLCGFAPFNKLPQAHNVSRFLAVLMEEMPAVLNIFHVLVDVIGKLIPDFGRRLAVDSKAIRSLALNSSQKMRKNGQPDRRGEHDASVAQKTKFVEKEDRTMEEVLYEWFGFKLHLMVDADHQMPAGFELSKGLEADTVHLEPLVKQFKEKHPSLAERTEEITADKAYDSKDNIVAARNEMGAQLLCPTRKLWREKDGSAVAPDGSEIKLKLLPGSKEGDMAYDQDGQLYCAFQQGQNEPWKWREMVFKGYEPDRQALKYICAARAYDVQCPSVESCRNGYKTQLRVKLSEDPRIFVPTPRHSMKFQRHYNRRTAVERVNSVLDTVLGFELHTIRGLAMASLRVALALCAMLAMSVGRIRAGQHKLYRSLIRAA